MTNEQLLDRSLTKKGEKQIKQWLKDVKKGDKVTLIGLYSKFPYITLEKKEESYILKVNDTETGEMTSSQILTGKTDEEMKEFLTFYAL